LWKTASGGDQSGVIFMSGLKDYEDILDRSAFEAQVIDFQ
jgi:hypothetical protein